MYKKLSVLFIVIGILLSDVMCAVVAYNYCDMVYGIEYKGWSAPAYVAYFHAIPFLLGIIFCAVLSFCFFKKSKKAKQNKG